MQESSKKLVDGRGGQLVQHLLTFSQKSVIFVVLPVVLEVRGDIVGELWVEGVAAIELLDEVKKHVELLAILVFFIQLLNLPKDADKYSHNV